MLVNIRNILLAAFFIGIVVSSKVSISYTLGSAVGFSLLSTLIAVILFCIPAGLYYIFKQRMLPNAGAWLWVIWAIVAVIIIGSIVTERLMPQDQVTEQAQTA